MCLQLMFFMTQTVRVVFHIFTQAMDWFKGQKTWNPGSLEQLYSYGHLLVITGYKWGYTFYKWSYKYL